MKIEARFVCKECGYISQSWIGKCPECQTWNSFIKELLESPVKNKKSIDEKIIKITDIDENDNCAEKTGEELLNSFFGDGIVSGSVTLLGGEPGIGKSTFLLFLTKSIPSAKKIYYFSGEESTGQIKKRADRTGANIPNLFISNISNIESIIKKCDEDKPDFLFIDSIQTVHSKDVDSGPGSISQIKYCASELIHYSKKSGVPVFMVGHITKSGDIAGPKILEHMVDTVVYFQTDIQPQYRMIRSIKNRFGSVNEILLFEMNNEGLVLLENSSVFFLNREDNTVVDGRARTIILEGRSPIISLVEALVVPSVYASPRVVSEGVDTAKVSRICAILTKNFNENINNYDIYLNISGGLKTRDVGLDFAVAVSIYSSKHKKPVDNKTAFIGELSLSGQIRSVSGIEIRVKELVKCGFLKIYLPSAVSGKIKNIQAELLFVDDINEGFSKIFK